jgi:DNA-binding response OmpR family regulator
MNRILIVDDQALVREPIAATLSGAGYQTFTAAGGNEGLAKAAEHLPDLILLDLSMPDMSGLEVLKSLRKGAATSTIPVILLTASADRAHVLEAAGLGVRDYLLKSKFSVSDLLNRVAKYLTSKQPRPLNSGDVTAMEKLEATTDASAPRSSCQKVRDSVAAAGTIPLDRDQVISRLEKAHLNALPGTVAELLALVSSSRGTMLDVADLIKRDPVLTSQVLKVANSAAYASSRGRISTVQDAVKHIGLGGTRNLIASIGILGTVVGQGGERALRGWQHALAVALLMEQLAPSDASSTGVAYVVGLCHDLPAVILEQVFSTEYDRIKELSKLTGKPQSQIESEMFPLPHQELASLALRRLGLPSPVTTPIDEFHGGLSNRCSILARTLAIANTYAHGLLLATGLDEVVSPLMQKDCDQVFADGLPNFAGMELRNKVLTTSEVLTGSSSTQAPAACEPLVRRSHHRICYVRPGNFATLDPLHELLLLSAEKVHVLPRWPAQPPEKADAIIFVSEDPEEMAQILHPPVDHHPSLPVLLLSQKHSVNLNATNTRITACHLPVTIKGVAGFLSRLGGHLRHAA